MDEPNAHYYDETLEQHEAFADCFTIAKHLYEQGYRKASDVARRIFEEIEEVIGIRLIDDDVLRYKQDLSVNYKALAKLKKKYENKDVD